MSEPHSIVIVGGGAGGVEMATRLGNTLGRKGRAEITLIDKASTHLWKPLLHEIAAGSMDLAEHELSYLAQGALAPLSLCTRRNGRRRSGTPRDKVGTALGR